MDIDARPIGIIKLDIENNIYELSAKEFECK